MPKKYLDVRDSCYERTKKKKGSLSEKDKKYCKKMASIVYWKLTGKPVKEANAELAIADEIENIDAVEAEILDEQIEFFGSFKEYEDWQSQQGEGDET